MKRFVLIFDEVHCFFMDFIPLFLENALLFSKNSKNKKSSIFLGEKMSIVFFMEMIVF